VPAAVSATLCALAPPAAADHSLTHCPAYPAEGDLRICSAQVPSFDGAELDVDLTLPMNDQRRQRHPLIVMLHGLGGNKRNWESVRDEGNGREKWHWNSHWFAKHGYYVLTYTARGHRDDRPSGDEPPTPGEGSLAGPSNTAHLKSTDFEIKDTQWLAALVADAFPEVDPNRVAVTGGSYGGGESWTQASQARWTFPNDEDPSLPVLNLQVAVPIIGWTDLAYSVVPNGHGGGPSETDIYESSIGHPDSPVGAGRPVGVAKESYLDALFALGSTELVWENFTSTTPSEEGPHSIPEWYARVIAGDPYPDSDPIVAHARRGTTEFRSSYYQDEEWADQEDGRKVAIFAIQGWQDDLFPAVEAFRQFKYLKRLDPRWPVALAVADLGHSRAQNKPETWRRVNDQSWQFLRAHINGSHQQVTTVYSEPTLCPNDGDVDSNVTASMRLTATTPEGLSNGALNVEYPAGRTISERPTPPAAEDQDNLNSDPAVGTVVTPEPCRRSTQPVAPVRRYTGVSEPLPDASTYVGLGHVTLDYVLEGAQTAVLNARVWDIAPDGTTLLVTRGTYRIDAPVYDSPAGTLRLPLFGNHWRFEPGHSIRLDLTQLDNPTFRASNEPSTIDFGPPLLTLPTREASTRELSGSNP
jgi:predicted acyl esterase